MNKILFSILVTITIVALLTLPPNCQYDFSIRFLIGIGWMVAIISKLFSYFQWNKNKSVKQISTVAAIFYLILLVMLLVTLVIKKSDCQNTSTIQATLPVKNKY